MKIRTTPTCHRRQRFVSLGIAAETSVFLRQHGADVQFCPERCSACNYFHLVWARRPVVQPVVLEKAKRRSAHA